MNFPLFLQLFHTVVDDRAKDMELYLVGMVCYYGKHYSTFFFHTKLRKWVYFDDAQVSEVSCSVCAMGHRNSAEGVLLMYFLLFIDCNLEKI